MRITFHDLVIHIIDKYKDEIFEKIDNSSSVKIYDQVNLSVCNKLIQHYNVDEGCLKRFQSRINKSSFLKNYIKIIFIK